MSGITLRYTSLDGVRRTFRFRTLAGARAKAARLVGPHPDTGSSYAVSFDGVGKVTVEGATLAELFPPPGGETPD